ncbi:MAG TPA: siderophore-interacting protein [Nocardioidaceae bacterium]
MTATATDVHRPAPMIVDQVRVVSVERLSPSFARIELGGPALTEFGVDGPLYDQRVKLIFPGPSGLLPRIDPYDDGWYAGWRRLPTEVRGHMRTYTVRTTRGRGAGTTLVVDFVLHDEAGVTGPGAAWAAGAQVGDSLVVVAPRRGWPFGGIEFAPFPSSRRLMLVADETAVPAVGGILDGLPSGLVGTAYLEVPVSADILDMHAPPGIDVVWLPRDGAELGTRLRRAVSAQFGVATVAAGPHEVDPDLWETPTYSSSGEPIDVRPPTTGAGGDLYAWVAGESAVVTGLRRQLVRELGLDRRQVAFMGYWRRGVAMQA